ncbi:hypothetical protein G5I_13382 [Acromyrmex echinatior]|uniref:Uncharacterized protein n=1 Tax=Acromyrmex echinatior TaxID=103372 RepID=F4X4W0_ACREC|nr:hypothetical protein G5I_13382 [Acromyrmex echinatior]
MRKSGRDSAKAGESSTVTGDRRPAIGVGISILDLSQSLGSSQSSSTDRSSWTFLTESSQTTLMRRLHLFQREHAHRQSKGREEDCGRRRTTIEVLGPVKSWAGSLEK